MLQDRGLVKEAPLSALEGTRLGIDAAVYVRRLLSSPATKEAFVPALGGCPLALEERIVEDMRALERAGVKPIFVFPGLPVQARQQPSPSSGRSLMVEDSRPAKRQAGWEHYEKNRNDQAMQAFAQTPLGLQDVLRVVHRCFLHRKTEFVVAPYLAWAQVSCSSISAGHVD